MSGTLSLAPDGSFSYVPTSSFTGTDSFTYRASDGVTTSAIGTVTLTVTNQAPVANPESYSPTMSLPLTVAAPGVLGNDDDPNGDPLSAQVVTGPAHGNVSLASNGGFTYQPDLLYLGSDSFTYRVSDGSSWSAPATVTLGVINATPVANDDSATTLHDTGTGGDVLANDSDANGHALTVALVGDVTHGSLSLDADGSWTYDPDPSYVGTDTFTYRASDGAATSNLATVTITVRNGDPVAGDDAYSVHHADVLTVAGPGVLTDDSDPDGDPISPTLVGDVAHGSLVFGTDGGFAYDPDPGYTGDDSFTYTVDDGIATSNLATVTITVRNGDPVAGDDAYSVHHADVLTVAGPGVLTDDSDPDGDPISPTLVGDVAHGSLVFGTDGGFAYDPDPGYTGDDSFTYTVDDGIATSNLATVTITVRNGDPVAGDDAYSVHHADVLTVAGPGVLTDDSDPDGDPISPTLVGDVAHGSLVFGTDGGFAYDPDPGYTGDDSFTYTVDDGIATSNLATVTITVRNGDPVAGDDAYSVHHGDVLTVAGPGVLTDDSDPDGDPISPTLVGDVAHGSLVFGTDGGFAYDPDPGYTGDDSFTYTVDDGIATSNLATVTITVRNGDPVAGDDAYSVHHGDVLTVAGPGVLTDDSDPDGDPISPTLVGDVAHGSLVFGTDGGFAYDPDPGYTGDDSFTYTVDDGIATSNLATVTITVRNGDPVAGDDAYSVHHDRQLVVPAPGVLGNDDDPDGDPLDVVVTAPPLHGTLSLSSTGRIVYLPDEGFVGVDTFSYTVSDGVATSTATVTLTVTNAAPVAESDSYAMAADGTLTIGTGAGVLANDDDANGDAIKAQLIASAGNGTVLLQASGAFIYTPDAGFVGTDSFRYVATDLLATSAGATVRIVVRAPPPDPDPTPSPEPSPEPSAEPTAAPSAEPSAEPTPIASAVPSTEPSAAPATPPASARPTDPRPGSSPEEVVETWSIGVDGGDANPAAEMPIANLAASTLGFIGRAFDWLVPGAMLTVPGLLLMLAIAAQAFGALAWLPLVRRKIGDFGLG